MKLKLIFKILEKDVFPPFFAEHLNLTEKLVEGQDIVLSCTWGGNPATSIQWQKDGQVLNNETPYKVETQNNNSRLLIQSAKKEDQGVFVCLIANSAGSNMSRCQVLVTCNTLKLINYFKINL